jgi:hypothetical protein
MGREVWISSEHSEAIRAAVAEALRTRLSMVGRQRVPPMIRRPLDQLEKAELQVDV